MRVSMKLMIATTLIAMFSILMKYCLFDLLLAAGIRDQTSLKMGHEVRDIYLKIPFPLNFKVYFFNVSNPLDVQNGSMPVLKEMGPYCYDEFKEKIDVVDNESEDSLVYTPYDIFKFNQSKSGFLSDEDYVTILHPIIVGMVNQVKRETPALLSIVNKAIIDIFQNPDSVYLTAKVKEILFDGVEINCRGKEFPANAVCTQLKSQIPGLKLKKGDDKVFLFTLLGSRNGTVPKRFKVLRGTSKSKDLGRLIELDNKKEINIWGTRQCNTFDGTDGWIFPPLLTPEEGIKSFSADLCRNIKVTYRNDTTVKKLNVRFYEADLGDMSANAEEKCYCQTPNTCLKKGVFDISKCMGAPMFATLPHFLNTDESYLQQVSGLNPDNEKHGIRVFFEPMTGTPIQAFKRMQFNFALEPTSKISIMGNLPTALHPVLWVEEGVDLEGDLLKKLQGIFLMIKIARGVITFNIFFCVVGFFVGLYYYKRNHKKIKITPVHVFLKEHLHESRDQHNMDKNNESEEKTGYVNHALSGHEFDRY